MHMKPYNLSIFAINILKDNLKDDKYLNTLLKQNNLNLVNFEIKDSYLVFDEQLIINYNLNLKSNLYSGVYSGSLQIDSFDETIGFKNFKDVDTRRDMELAFLCAPFMSMIKWKIDYSKVIITEDNYNFFISMIETKIYGLFNPSHIFPNYFDFTIDINQELINSLYIDGFYKKIVEKIKKGEIELQKYDSQQVVYFRDSFEKEALDYFYYINILKNKK